MRCFDIAIISRLINVKTILNIISAVLFITSILKPQELTWNHLGGPMGGCIGDFGIDSQR